MMMKRVGNDHETAANTTLPRPISNDDWGFLVDLASGPSTRPALQRIEPSYMALDTGGRRVVLAICIIALLALAGFAAASLPDASKAVLANPHPDAKTRTVARERGTKLTDHETAAPGRNDGIRPA